MNSYKIPPIIEAVIDFRIKPKPGAGLDVFHKVKEKLPEYPQWEEMSRWETQIGINAGVVSAGQSKQLGNFGLRGISKDKQRIIQIRFDGFTFSWLKPYRNWETFSTEAKEIWAMYSASIQPEVITRTAVRYLNVIEIPEKLWKFEDYFKTYPQTPDFSEKLVTELKENGKKLNPAQSQYSVEDCKSDINRFQFQAIFDFGKLNINCILNMADKLSPDGTFEGVLLDIDAFSLRPFSLNSQASSILPWDMLDFELRSVKNAVFASSITAKTDSLIRSKE